jgi:sulfur-oxidizing protein SoxZ
MTTIQRRLRVPATAVQGEVIEIRTLIAHPMETGLRHDEDGRPVPEHIIRRFVCHYDAEVVFSADWHPAVSAYPYLAFTTVATETGVITVAWHDDDGSVHTESATITVT